MYDSGIHYLQPRSMQKAQTLSESQREMGKHFCRCSPEAQSDEKVPEKAIEANLVLMEEPLFYRHLQMPSYRKYFRGEAVEVG